MLVSLSPASVTELLFHPASFVESGRPPSACFDPIMSSPSLPGFRERSRCQSADFSLWKALERLGGTFPAKAHVQVRLVTYRVTLVRPSSDMIMPQVRTSERICDVERSSSSIHRHLSKIWIIWNCNNMKIIDHSETSYSFMWWGPTGAPSGTPGGPLTFFGDQLRRLIHSRHAEGSVFCNSYTR